MHRNTEKYNNYKIQNSVYKITSNNIDKSGKSGDNEAENHGIHIITNS